jgi:hypothetical protein
MILVASTMARYVTDRAETSLSWLNNAEEMRALSPEPLEFFAALQVDGQGLDAFKPVMTELLALNISGESSGTGGWYSYRYSDNRETIETGNRLWHICAGRNIIQDRAMDIGASHILFLDADMEPPADCISKLLELDWPIVGGHVPTYNLRGPRVQYRGHCGPRQMMDERLYPEEWDVQAHMNTAGFLLVAREVFKRVRWRWSAEDGMTDDPCYEADAREFLGYPTYVRHDVVGKHHPESIVRIEDRFPDRDMTVAP